MKRRINAILTALLITFAGAVSCTKPDPGTDPAPGPSPDPGPDPGPNPSSLFVAVQTAPYQSGGATLAEEDWSSLQACLFDGGKMVARYDQPTESEQGLGFELDRDAGTLYVLTRGEGMPDLKTLLEAGISEQEWLSMHLGTLEGEPIRFFSGRTTLSQEQTAPVQLTRGYARFDLQIRTVGDARIERLQWEGCALQTTLLADEGLPAAESGTVESRPANPYTEDTAGVAYLYEQQNPEAVLRAEAVVHGKSCRLEVPLPEQIRRNHIYVVTLTKQTADQDAQLSIEEWEQGEGTDLYPDLEMRISVDAAHSELPLGASTSDDGTRLTLPHGQTEFLLALSCHDELELQPVANERLKVEPVSRARTPEERNLFRISKPLYAPGMETEQVDLIFRRKGLANIYPEDRITVTLQANPVQLEGMISFDEQSYAFDFDRYVDNELARFTLPAEKELLVEFADGEDAWIQLTPDTQSDRTIRVLGGWRPNDPKADGRIQQATLVIRNAADGSERESYRISRRNYGLPVTWLHGVWWCKYNARGNSRSFDDQVLCPADPAVLAGKSVLDYLRDCSAEEFYNLWGWAYQGDSGEGMRVVEQNGILVMEGFSTNVTAHINKLPADALAPDGYELPSMEEFNRLFDATDYVWMMWSGSHILRNPWNGHSKVTREQRRRNDITIGSVQASDLLYSGLSSPDFPEHEAVVWYGPGAQWNADGIKHSNHYNNILMGVYSPEGSGWYMAGSMAGLYMSKNGAGNKDTRILRFKKSPVEYIY